MEYKSSNSNKDKAGNNNSKHNSNKPIISILNDIIADMKSYGHMDKYYKNLFSKLKKAIEEK